MALLKANTAYKPFTYPWAVEFAVTHEKIHWGEWEAKLQDDVAQWKGGKISTEEKKLSLRILS